MLEDDEQIGDVSRHGRAFRYLLAIARHSVAIILIADYNLKSLRAARMQRIQQKDGENTLVPKVVPSSAQSDE